MIEKLKMSFYYRLGRKLFYVELVAARTEVRAFRRQIIFASATDKEQLSITLRKVEHFTIFVTSSDLLKILIEHIVTIVMCVTHSISLKV